MLEIAAPGYLWRADGSLMPGWPTKGRPNYFCTPSLADVDGDGDLEIILGHWSGAGSTARCFHHDGTVYDGFPISIATSIQLFSLGLGDVTGDGDPELIAFDNHLSSDFRVHVIGLADGLSLPGWPIALPAWPKGIPTVADVDGDGVQDVCFVTDAGLLYAVAGDGQPLAGYPKTMVSGSISGVAVGDIDGDGLFELVAATWDGWVYAWDTPAQANPELADWPMRGVDARNTGVFGADDQTTAVGELNPTPRFGLRILGNPVTARVEFLIEGDAAAATLEIFDVNGRRVDELSVDGRQRLLWHPDPILPAGVYLARLTDGRNVETAKFVIVR
ncbi:MAG: T9SS type A sorting domain-containing protein [Candidatus Krumholzibacteria bacterium]|nr:T9SS type A sorting domain-containing protein [Candidatus Krumholzibacteria bacterium]